MAKSKRKTTVLDFVAVENRIASYPDDEHLSWGDQDRYVVAVLRGCLRLLEGSTGTVAAAVTTKKAVKEPTKSIRRPPEELVRHNLQNKPHRFTVVSATWRPKSKKSGEHINIRLRSDADRFKGYTIRWKCNKNMMSALGFSRRKVPQKGDIIRLAAKLTDTKNKPNDYGVRDPKLENCKYLPQSKPKKKPIKKKTTKKAEVAKTPF